MSDFTKVVIVLVDMGGKSKKKTIPYYTTEARHYDVLEIVKCFKSAQIEDLAKVVKDIFYMNVFFWAWSFKNFIDTYKIIFYKHVLPHSLGLNIIHLKFSEKIASTIISPLAKPLRGSDDHDC